MKEKILNYLEENEQELMQDMKNVQHGYKGVNPNPYHLEGSIYTHTLMVMDVVQYKFKNDEHYLELIFSAALHDIGKTKTFEDNDERQTRSFKCHESLSTFMAKGILERAKEYFNLTDKFIVSVLKTISFHGHFYNDMDINGIKEKSKEKIKREFKQLQNIETLIILAKFFYSDSTGRITSTPRADSEMVMNQLIELADEIKTTGNTFKTYTNELSVLIGPPRSGKSTFIRNGSNNFKVLSRDYYIEKYGKGDNYSEKWKSLTKEDQEKIDKELMQRFNLIADSNVVIDMTNMSKKSRRKFLNHPKYKNHFKVAHVFIEEPEVLLARNTNEKNISENVIYDMIKRYCAPLNDEFNFIKYVV